MKNRLITQVRTNGVTFIGGVSCIDANGKPLWLDFDDRVQRLTKEDAQEDALRIAKWHCATDKSPDFVSCINI
jgi:hypothetical protein